MSASVKSHSELTKSNTSDRNFLIPNRKVRGSALTDSSKSHTPPRKRYSKTKGKIISYKVILSLSYAYEFILFHLRGNFDNIKGSGTINILTNVKSYHIYDTTQIFHIYATIYS